MKIPPLVPLRRQTQPFDDPYWIYEIKHDGFRAKLDAERKRGTTAAGLIRHLLEQAFQGMKAA